MIKSLLMIFLFWPWRYINYVRQGKSQVFLTQLNSIIPSITVWFFKNITETKIFKLSILQHILWFIWSSWYWENLWLSKVIHRRSKFSSRFIPVISLQSNNPNPIWFTTTTQKRVPSLHYLLLPIK